MGSRDGDFAKRLGRMAVVRALIDEVERQLAELIPDDEEEDEEEEDGLYDDRLGGGYEERMDDHSDYSDETPLRPPIESSIFNSAGSPRQLSSVTRYGWGPVQQRPL